MSNHPASRFAWALALMLVFATAAWGQKGGAAGAGLSNMPDNGPANPQVQSAAEQAAVEALDATFSNPATNADAMAKAIADFVAKFPKSDFVYHANRLGVQYFSTSLHGDADRVAVYAQKSLKLLPDDLFTLATAGEAVPRFETATDPNLIANLNLADQWNNKLLGVARYMPGANAPLTAANPSQSQLKAEADREKKLQLEYNAYIALARSAVLRQTWPAAQQDYEKALAVADFKPAGADMVRAETYLGMAQAQEQAKQWSAAAASLAQAAKLGAASAELLKRIADEQARVQAAQP